MEKNSIKDIEPQHIQNNKDKPVKKRKKTKMLINIGIVLVLTVLSIWLTLGSDFSKIMDNLTSIFLAEGNKWQFLIYCELLLLAGSFIRILIMYCFARLFTRNYSFAQSIAVDHIGTFYNAVTPGATGGQPMQAYVLSKQGIPVSSAISMLAMCSILYQITLIVYGLVSFIVKYNVIDSIGAIPFNIVIGELRIPEFSIPIWPLTIIGFLLNVGVIAIVLLMGYSKIFHRFIMGPCISLLAKIKILKNPDKNRESLKVQVENFKIEMRRISSNIPFAALVIFLFAVVITLRYSAPYFIGLALGNESTCSSFMDAVFLSNYHQMVTGLIPIPGSAGVSEMFFTYLFVANQPTAGESFYYMSGGDPNEVIKNSKNLASAALLIWRTLTFILPLLVSGAITAFYRASPKDVINENGDIPSRDTFIDLQSQTMAVRFKEVETIVETSKLSRQAIINRMKITKKKEKKNKQNIKSDYDDIKISNKDDSI